MFRDCGLANFRRQRKAVLVLQEPGLELFLLMLRKARIDVESWVRSFVPWSRCCRIGEGESIGGFYNFVNVADRCTFVHVFVLFAEIHDLNCCFFFP